MDNNWNSLAGLITRLKAQVTRLHLRQARRKLKALWIGAVAIKSRSRLQDLVVLVLMLSKNKMVSQTQTRLRIGSDI